jgi:ketosteroid isomerase-like protein
MPGEGNAMTETNREIVRDAFAAWQEGTGAIGELFAPGMVWRVEGRCVVAGEYASKQEFVAEVLAPFAARFSASDPLRPSAVRSIHADGDTVIALWDGRGIATDGGVYENTYAWFMEMRDGRVVDGTALFDGVAFDELWNRVHPAN